MQTLQFLVLNLLIFFSSASVAQTDNFDHRYSQYTKNKAPGFHIVVMKEGVLLKDTSYGYAFRDEKKKITNTTKFRIASNTKAFTAAATLLLEQEGKLDPEEKVRKYIPELPQEFKELKIKHLIHHTSGLPEYDGLCEHKESTKKVVTNSDILNWLIQNPKLSFKPGSTFSYSNTGYNLLASVIERITKTTFPTFIQERFFNPLKMNDATFFSPDSEKTMKDRARGYNSWPWFELKDRDSCNYTYGEDGIYLSSSDYTKWARALSEEKVFSPTFQKKLFQTEKTDEGKLNSYTYGWFLNETDFGQALVHGGSWVGFKSQVRYYPAKKIWIFVFSNYTDIPLRDIMDRAIQHYL